MDTVLHALADRSRRTLLEILRDHPASAGELADARRMSETGIYDFFRKVSQNTALTP